MSEMSKLKDAIETSVVSVNELSDEIKNLIISNNTLDTALYKHGLKKFINNY